MVRCCADFGAGEAARDRRAMGLRAGAGVALGTSDEPQPQLQPHRGQTHSTLHFLTCVSSV